MRSSSFLAIASVVATVSASALNLPVPAPIPISRNSTFPLSLPGSILTGGALPSLPVSKISVTGIKASPHVPIPVTSVLGISASPSLPVSVTSVPGTSASPSLPVSGPSVPNSTAVPSIPVVSTDPTVLLAKIQSAIQILEVLTALLNNSDLQIPELGPLKVDSPTTTTLLAIVRSLLKV